MEQMTLADAARVVLLGVAPLLADGALAACAEQASDAATANLAEVWRAVELRFRRELSAAERAELAQVAAVVEARMTGQTKAARALDYFRADPRDAQAQQIVEGQLIQVFRSAPEELSALSRSIVTMQPALRDELGHALLPPELSADGVHFSFGHALIIGVGAYAKRTLESLGATAANDARALGSLLRDPHFAAYPDEQVHVLVDAKATRDRILDALEGLAYRAEGGRALIFFAGQGELDGDSYTLLPYDADPDQLAETALSAEVFHRRVHKIGERAKQMLVLLNCCHAKGDAFAGMAPPPSFYQPLVRRAGQAVISASRPDQRAGAESHTDAQHTVFGAQLLAALAGKAPGVGPSIGAFELFAHLRTHVPVDAQHSLDQWQPLRQEPVFYAAQLEDNLPLALRPGWHSSASAEEQQQQMRRLVELELALDSGDTPGASLRALVAERERLLRELGGLH